MRSTHEWTKKEIKFLCSKYAYYTNQELADLLGVTKRHISNKATKLGLRGKLHGKDGRFVKGNESWNKGLKGLQLSPATQWKKGEEPRNAKYDGAISERQNSCGKIYLYVRLAKSRWELLHRVVWQSYRGDIPASHMITFKDGNTRNCDIANLECIPRRELANVNRNPVKMVETTITGSKELVMINNDNYIAGRMTRDKQLKKEIKKNKELLDLKRNSILLKREMLNVRRRDHQAKA